MNDLKYKKVLLLGAFFLFFCHISITCIYSFPEFFPHPFIQNIVYRYMFPFFNQSNRVFAPDPPLFSHDLYYALYSNGKWTGNYSLLSSLNQEHYENRLSSSGTQLKLADYHYYRLYDELLLAYYFARKEENLTQSQHDSIVSARISASDAFKNLTHYLLKKRLSSFTCDSIKFSTVHKYPPAQHSSSEPRPIFINSPAVAFPK